MQKKVLIVEDNALNQRLFNDLLAAEGYATLSASDGASALSLARKTRPDLILMDINLPRQSGIQATRRLKQDDALSDIPVIAVTAHAMDGDEQRIREAGCQDYIAKPVSLPGLLNLVRRHIC